jgi:hypothetical protein
LKTLLQEQSYDVAILDHTAMWQCRRMLDSVPLVGASAHDVLSQLWSRKASMATHPMSRWLLKREYRRMESWERAALRKLDFVAPHSEKDSHLLNALDSAVPQCPIQPWHTPAPDRVTTPRDPFSVVFLLPRDILVAVVGLATTNLVAPEFIASLQLPL